MRGSARVRSAVVIFALCLFIVGAAPAAFAATWNTLTRGAPDYVAGAVPLVVATTDSGVATVTLDIKRSGSATRTVTLSENPPLTYRYTLALSADTTVVAHALGGSHGDWGYTMALRRASYSPYAPGLALRQSGAVMDPDRAITGSCDSRTVTMTVQYQSGSRWIDVWSRAIGPGSSRFSLRNVRLPSDHRTIRVVAANGFGSNHSATRSVYSLGKLPDYAKLVLIDKEDRRLWVIRDHVVTFTCACAIGMPWAPTPTGTFRLGARHKTPNRVWGPWRLRLSHRIVSHGKVRYVPTSYYIHGTNDPSSIGEMASHGCIRLLNNNIRRLSTVIDGYMVRIRE